MPKNRERKINFPGMPTPARLTVKMEQMKTQLMDVRFDKLIEDSKHLLPASVHNDFHGFTQKILDSKDGNVFVFIENWEWFSLSTQTPEPVEKLLKEIEKHARVEENSDNKKKLAEFARRIRWKWCTAAFKYAYYYKIEIDGAFSTAEQYQVNIDPKGDPIDRRKKRNRPFSVDIDLSGTRSFDLTVRTMPIGAVEHKSGEANASVVVAALGDALANTHFRSGAGMSIGREGVEILVKSVNDVTSGKTKDKHEFATNLAVNLKEVANDAVMLAEKFVPNMTIPVAQHQTK